MFILGSTFEELLDPLLTGGDPVEVGFGETQDAHYVRALLSERAGSM